MRKNLSPFFLLAIFLHAGVALLLGIDYAKGTPGRVGAPGAPGKPGLPGRPGNPEPIKISFSYQKPSNETNTVKTIAKVVKNRPHALAVSSKTVEASSASQGQIGEGGQGGEGGEGGQNGQLGDGSHGKVDVVALYKAELRAKIERNKSYPPMSRRLGQVGTVVVSFTVEEDGKIVNVQIDEATQFERLNDSALEAVKKVMRFRPIPSEFGQTTMDVKIPIKFVTI